MRSRFVTLSSVAVLVLGLASWSHAAAAPAAAGASLATGPESSVTTRLADRREVDSGTGAYSLGFEDGRFYANGWHTTGEMGGIWTPPIKLLDGVWFGLDNQWIGPATKFNSGWGYTRFDLPTTAGLSVSRTDFVPDGPTGVVFGLTITNPGAARTTKLSVDAHSELMSQYPWGFAGMTPNASDNIADQGSYNGKQLVFTDDGALPGAPEHHYSAVVGTSLTPTSGTIGHQFWGPQPGHVCTGTETGAPADPKPSACDDGPFGRGTGGELTYSVNLPANGSRTIWLGVAGSTHSVAQARKQLTQTLHDPAGTLAAKVASRQQLADNTQLSLPGNPQLQQAIDWGKQNMADLTHTADDLQIRWTNQGKQFPAPSGTVPKATWIGAGYPDYPWIFGTDAEYTAFASVAVGQFDAIEGHLRTLQEVSDILNDSSGVVAHEVVSDGSVYYGHDSQTTNADGTKTNDFNTDETVKFPSTVALVWRWTGDRSFLNDMYNFTVRNMRYVAQHLVGSDGWPTGSGNVEVTGMGPEKLDNAVYYIRGLYDLADMAQVEHDNATYTWASNQAKTLRNKFEKTWWFNTALQYADSLNPDGSQLFQEFWIGQVPMEAELHIGSRTTPGLASTAHGTAALAGRENDCYSGTAPLNTGLFHTGCTGADANQGIIFGLTTSIQSVGEGNYGRLGADQQGRYLDALTQTMFDEPATGGTPDEQPGAMPEIFPSPNQGANIDRCWTCRSMFMQAWGNYGTVWPVVHQWLGVRPDLGVGGLEVTPQVPQGQTTVQGTNIKLGGGAIDVHATHTGNAYQTDLTVGSGVGATSIRVGQTLPAGAHVAGVTLDGRALTQYRALTTNRGLEVTVPTQTGQHTLVVTTS